MPGLMFIPWTKNLKRKEVIILTCESDHVKKQTLIIKQGDDYRQVFTLTNSKGDPINTDNCKFIFWACYSSTDKTTAIAAECEIMEKGKIKLLLKHDETAKLRAANPIIKFNLLYYDIQMLKGDQAQTVLEGEVHVKPGNAFKKGSK